MCGKLQTVTIEMEQTFIIMLIMWKYPEVFISYWKDKWWWKKINIKTTFKFQNNRKNKIQVKVHFWMEAIPIIFIFKINVAYIFLKNEDLWQILCTKYAQTSSTTNVLNWPGIPVFGYDNNKLHI